MQYIAGLFLITTLLGVGAAGWYKIEAQNLELENQRLVIEIEVEKSNAAEALKQQQIQAAQVAEFEVKIKALNEENAKARAQVQYTRNLFADHDFQNLMEKKPGLITTRMQNATDKVFSDLNALTSE